MTRNDDPSDIAPVLQEKLFEQLREASWMHQHPDVHPQITRWTGAIMACHAVAQFIRDAGRAPELAAPLMEMMKGFKDLERGITPPIFSVNSEPLKRDRSSHRKFNQMWAAAIMEISMGGDEGEKVAANRIARSVSKWFVFQNQEVTGTTITNWRKAIKCGSLEERKPFEAICAELRAGPDAETTIKKVLDEGPPGMAKS